MKRPVLSTLLLAMTMGLGLSAEAASTLNLGQAQELMKQGKNDEAYGLLLPYEFDNAGNIDYDYTLGVAALESGHADRATLALERVLAVNPNFLAARMDLARGYFALNDMDRAEEQFKLALSQNPPPEAQKAIDQYLAAIEERRKAAKTSVRGYLEASLGYDSNVNNASDTSIIYVPAFQVNMTLAPTSLESSSAYLQVAGDVVYDTEVKEGVRGFLGGGFRGRDNFSEKDFSNSSVNGRGGFRFQDDKNSYTVAAGAQQYFLAGSRYWDRWAVNGEWRRSLDQENQVLVFGQYNQFRYQPANMTSEDMNQFVGGVGVFHMFPDNRTLGYATLFGGNENAVNDRADGNKSLWGVKFGAQSAIREDVQVYGALGATSNSYDKENLTFQVTRDDKFYDVTLGVNWKVNKNWYVRPEVVYYLNDSNISIYQYNRTDASVAVRYVF